MPIDTKQITHTFIQIAEKIANSKIKPLDFGKGMILFRGEIHIIKAIGDQEKISSSEIARQFGITRAVIHKTLLKLEKEQYVIKKNDLTDRKKILLYLTDKGKAAYMAHETYHNEQDKIINEFLNKLPPDHLHTIQQYLDHTHKILDLYF